MTNRTRGCAVGAAALALTVLAAAPASAATVSPPLASGLVGPLGLAVARDGTAYVAQSFTDTVTRVAPGGARTDVLTGARGVAGVTPEADGSLVYTYSVQPESGPQVAQLRRLWPGGKTTILGFLGREEFGQNPDRGNSYGFQGLSASCAKQVPPEIGGKPYPGLKDTHPYAVAALGGGSYAVADAGANAIFKVGPDQRVSTLAVLPPVPVTITAGAAQGLGLPACVVGKAYNFEPVPTDVEVGPDGLLYVSSLAGGPEDGSLGALGGVFTVDPGSGAVQRIGSGFAGATGLAVGPQGRVYVAELFGGRVSYLKGGHPATFARVSLPGAVEFARGKLYVTTDVLPPEQGAPDGKLVTITP